MLEIIKRGAEYVAPTVYRATCKRCGCEFRFDSDYIEDVTGDYKAIIRCPDCKVLGFVGFNELKEEPANEED